MLEQNEINEHWPVGESHRRLLQYQSELLTLTEFEMLMKASFGIVISYCLVHILKMWCFHLIRINFFLAVKGARVIFQHCGLVITVIPLGIPKDRHCETQEEYLQSSLSTSLPKWFEIYIWSLDSILLCSFYRYKI